MRTILSLTEYERQLAEQYHEMVYIYLKTHHYDIEEYYDIAVMGLLAGVQQWNRNEGTKEKYSISTICKRNIHGTIATHLRDENRQKRKPSGGFTSLDLQLEDSNESFINSIITPTLEDEFFAEYDRQHEDETIRELLKPLTKRQRNIAVLIAYDETRSAILKELHISKKTLSKEYKKIKTFFPNALQPRRDKKESCAIREYVRNIPEYIGVEPSIVLALKLSPRQASVAKLLIDGWKESDIGRELGISRQAVYDAVKKIRQKAEKVR